MYNRYSRIKFLNKAYCYILKLKQKICLDYSSFIQNISVFTKDFKNHKTYFKPLISGKIIFNHLNISLKTFHDVYLGLCLVCWFTSLRDFFIWKNVYVVSIVSIAHAVLFSKQEVLRRRAVRGSSSESECS